MKQISEEACAAARLKPPRRPVAPPPRRPAAIQRRSRLACSFVFVFLSQLKCWVVGSVDSTAQPVQTMQTVHRYTLAHIRGVMREAPTPQRRAVVHLRVLVRQAPTHPWHNRTLLVAQFVVISITPSMHREYCTIKGPLLTALRPDCISQRPPPRQVGNRWHRWHRWLNASQPRRSAAVSSISKCGGRREPYRRSGPATCIIHHLHFQRGRCPGLSVGIDERAPSLSTSVADKITRLRGNGVSDGTRHAAHAAHAPAITWQ